jgi:hypothetical protein
MARYSEVETGPTFDASFNMLQTILSFLHELLDMLFIIMKAVQTRTSAVLYCNVNVWYGESDECDKFSTVDNEMK